MTCGPKCQTRLRWDATQQGKAVAANDQPLIDDLDRRILTALAFASVRPATLARMTGVCFLTAKRRVGLMVGRGLVVADADGRFKAASKARAALGPDAPTPWLDQERIRASTSKDVMARLGADVMARDDVARLGGIARARQMHPRSGKYSYAYAVG